MATSSTPAVNLPEWMTKEYFVDAIATKLDLSSNSFTITDLDVRPATESGDNYASILYRVRVTVLVQDTGAQTDVSLIVKALPNLGLSEEMIQQMNLFPKEMAMYTKILPAFEKLYHERGREDVVFGPRCLKHSTSPTDVIVLEDLRERQYTMANRRQGMDMNHTRLVLRRLAMFHAASAVHYQRYGSFGELFREGMFAEKGRAMNEHFQKGQADFMYKLMSERSEEEKAFAEYMRHWGMDLFDALLRITQADPTKFNVLNHGDMWCNNMLFHYNADQQVDDIVLIDFQLGVYSSPAIDLLYFMFTSVNGDDRLPQMNYMIQYYHEHLVENLTFLGYEAELPLLKDLHSDVIAHSLFGFTMCFAILPICLMEKTDDASMDLMLGQDEAGIAFKVKMYTNPAYVKQMKDISEYFFNMGAFDVLQIGTQRAARIECALSLQLPLWLDLEFIEHIVDAKFGTSTTGKRVVRNVYVENATKKSDAFAAAMYSVKVELFWTLAGTEETLSLVIKAPPKGNAAIYAQTKKRYVRERLMYEEFIPAFETLYQNKGVTVKLGPSYYKPRYGLPVEVIVLEDLARSGFLLARGQDGLDQAHAEVVLEHLAKFHAASAVYCENSESLPKELTDAFTDCAVARDADKKFATSLDNLLTHMKRWEFAVDFVDELEAVSRQICTLLVETYAVDSKSFNVLTHGDAWLNNILFSYDTDIPTQVAMIDYQSASWGSPVLDLIHFLFSSVDANVKLSKQAYFLRYYQERLVQNLLLLGYKKPLPTLLQLHVDFNHRLSVAIKSSMIDLPYALVDRSDNATEKATGELKETGLTFEQVLYDNDRFKEQMKTLLPYFRSRGVLTPLAANCRKQ
ncbi:uncharacterized protein LOC128721643 [Anopheles nili]|uniref:uncharacterized protein LOC128721643 n=1 Tax=Anopheles nili TaxID=185578 RepID=UPI00237A6B0A|nr:uncharacterized protein LOC128721643 [Anopheles nili]